jgi:hypothetical protein
MRRSKAFELEYLDPAGRRDCADYFDTREDAEEARDLAKTEDCNEGFTFQITPGELIDGIFYPDP